MTQQMSHASLELLAYLRKHGASTHEDLHLALSPGRPHVRPHDTTKRMNNLRALGWIDYELNAKGEKRWYATGRMSPAARAPRSTCGATPAGSTPALPVAPPRTYNFMQGHWQQPAGPVMRAGAFDYQRCASHGVRC